MGTEEQLIQSLAKDICSREFILFSGAGIGIEAGLHSWENSLQLLAEHIKAVDEDISSAMIKRVRSEKYLEAADLYYRALATPKIIYDGLEMVFKITPHITDNLRSLIRLNFSGFVTTSYDLTIENSYSDVTKRALLPLSNLPAHFVSAQRCIDKSEHFIIHIHGSVADLSNIVLASEHYEHLYNLEAWKIFLVHLLRTRSVLFLCSSFKDPSLKLLFQYASKYLNIICEQPSYAFVSKDDKETMGLLQGASVNVIPFDSGSDHRGIWRLIHDLIKQTKPMRNILSIDKSPVEIDRMKSSLAAVYSYYKIHSEHLSIAKRIYNGLLYSSILHLGIERQAINIEDIKSEIRKIIFSKAATSDENIKSSLLELSISGEIEIQGDNIVIKSSQDNLHNDIELLANSVRDRALVRYGKKLAVNDEIIRNLLTVALLEDGIRLAHSILSKLPLASTTLDSIIDRACDKLFSGKRNEDIEILCKSIGYTIQNPNPAEAEILCSVSRISFLTDIAIHVPDLESITMRGRAAKVYLDSNIVLPAVVKFHPRNVLYRQIISRAIKRGMVVVISEGFIEELLVHRENAVKAFQAEFAHNEDKFRNYVIFNGSDNINVFLGGFSGWLYEKKIYDFAQFLSECAPFSNEAEVVNYLMESLGIKMENLQKDIKIELGRISRWNSSLNDWYKDKFGKSKDKPLTWHEACQLEALAEQLRNKVIVWLVSADKKLLSAAAEISQIPHLYPEVASVLLTPIQFSYYIDMDDVRTIDWSGYSKILWSRKYRDNQVQYSEYYITRILSYYEPMIAKGIPIILDKIRTQIENAPVEMGDIEDPEDLIRIRNFRYLEQFEPKFYAIMREAMEEIGLKDKKLVDKIKK